VSSKKTFCGICGQGSTSYYDKRRRRVRDLSCGDTRVYLELEVKRVDCLTCGGVKLERLEWLADNPFYTKRFAFLVGRRCRTATIKDVARELRLDWETVKELEKQYMREQLRRVDRVTGSKLNHPVCGKAEGRRQKAEGRRQKAEGRRQKAEGRRQK
jgi:transposase